MRHDFSIRLIRFLFSVMLVVLMISTVSGQTKPSAKVANKEETVSILDISKQSSEAIIDTRRIKERLVNINELLKEKHKIDSLVNSIETQIKKVKKSDMAVEGLRKLETHLIFLQQEQSLLGKEKNGLNAQLDHLVESKNMLTTNIEYWKKVKQTVRQKKLGKSIEKSVDNVLSVLNNTLLLTNRLTNITMGMIRSISALELEILTRVTFIHKLRQQKQGELLSAKQPSLFSINYSDKKIRNLSEPLSQFYKVDLKNLKHFLDLSLNTVIFNIILIISLIVVFIRLSRSSISLETGEGLFYKKWLKKLLSKPISTALIIGLFASVILYSNRPLVFRDMMLLLVIVPMVILLRSLFDKQFRVYIYILAVVLAAHIVYSYLPVGNIYSRFLLLFISLIELLTVLHFIFNFKTRMKKGNIIERIIIVLCYGFLLLIVVGLFGSVFGKVMLARYLLFSVSGIVLVSFLITVTAIMINGTAVIFISGNLAGKSNVIRKNKYTLLKKVPRFINFIASIVLIYYILIILGWSDAVVGSLSDWLSNSYKIGSLTFSWGKLFVFLFIIWFSIFLAKIVRAVLEDDMLNKVKMEEGLPHTIAMMARYSLITLGVILAFSALGMPMSDLAIIFSAFGVGIGFGLQSIFNNLVSGFILLFERPIKIGDTIEVGELVGTVRSIGIRASNIRTFDGAEIIVPNGNLISNEVVNWTLSDQRRRIEIKVSVSYKTDPARVTKILLGLLEGHEDVANDPQPGIYFIEMGDNALIFRVLFWTYQYGKWYSIRSKIMYEIFDTLKAAGIEIPYNQLDLHLRSSDVTGIHPKSIKDIKKSQ